MLELPSLPLSVTQCRDVLCTDYIHRIAHDNYIEDVIGASKNVSKQFIPYTRAPKDSANDAGKRKVIPGWSDLVVPKNKEAKYPYQLWLSPNKTRTDDLFNNMCRYKSG